MSSVIFVGSFTINLPEISVLPMCSSDSFLFTKWILKQLSLIFKIDLVSLLMTSFGYKLKRLLYYLVDVIAPLPLSFLIHSLLHPISSLFL